MVGFLEALKYAIPSIVVFMTAYLLLKQFFSQEMRKHRISMIEEKKKASIPLRMQAYERIILLLERISPKNLIMRSHDKNMSAAQLHSMLIRDIRDEFDHNISQQLYISSRAWEMVKNAKEEIVSQINTCAGKLDDKATSTDLSKKILEKGAEKTVNRKALEFLKEEARKSFL